MMNKTPAVDETAKRIKRRSNDTTAVERNRRLRERLLKDGGRQLNLLLDAAGSQALDALRADTGETVRACITRLLLEAKPPRAPRKRKSS